MADMDSRESWVERELGRALSPVRAPEGLWAAIHRPRETRRQLFSLEWAFWPATAVILLLALAGVLRSHTLDQPAPTVSASSASNCHTPVYAITDVRLSAARHTQEGCLACHFNTPGMLVITLP
jgi:hypothetical protein